MMQKEFDYILNVEVNQDYPALPALHDYKIFDVSFNNGVFSFTCREIDSSDNDYSYMLDFKPKKVTVKAEVENKYCLEFELTKFKYGRHLSKRTSVLNIEDFLKIYKKYAFCVLYNLVACNRVRFELWGNKHYRGRGHYEGAILIDCKSVKYIWED